MTDAPIHLRRRGIRPGLCVLACPCQFRSTDPETKVAAALIANSTTSGTFFAEFGVQAFTGLGNLIDETSGLTGKTLKDGAALHRFLANIGQAATQMRVAGGIVQPAEPPCDRRSPRRVLKITSKANIPLITLQRQRASTKRSVCGNRDQMGGIVNDLQAVRDLSKNIGFYSRKMWHQLVRRSGALRVGRSALNGGRRRAWRRFRHPARSLTSRRIVTNGRSRLPHIRTF